MTKILILASALLILTSCSELAGILDKMDNVTTPSNPETPPTPPTEPEPPVVPPTEPDEPIIPPINPEEPEIPPTPPIDPEEPETPPTPPIDPEDPDTPPIEPPIEPEEPDNPDKRPLCPTIVENDALKAISDKYPAYAIGVGNFVAEEGYMSDSTTDRAKAERLQITPQDRERILGIFGIIRVVVNSEEFKENFMDSRRSYPSGDTWSFGLGSITKGEELNKDRYLKVIRKFALNIGITKRFIGGDNANARAGAFLYLHEDSSWAWDKNQRKVEINLPNFISWSEPIIDNMENKYANDSWLASILFHESIHLAGFKHLKGPNNQINRNDAIYSVEQVFKDTYNDAFRNKYAQELAELSQYYKETYVNWINYETLLYPNDSCITVE